MDRKKDISEVLRSALKESGTSQRDIETATGIPQASLSRFLTGKRGLLMQDIDKLAAYFGLELVKAKPARTGMTDDEARKAIRGGAEATKRVNDAIRDRKRGG